MLLMLTRHTNVAALGGGLDSDGIHHLFHGHQLAALSIEEAGQASDRLLHMAFLVSLDINVSLQQSTKDCFAASIPQHPPSSCSFER